MSINKDILKDYKLATVNLMEMFSKKHDYQFDGFVGGNISGIAEFGDYYINVEDVYYDLNTNQPEDMFIKWYDYILENHEKYGYTLNYKTYCMGGRYEIFEQSKEYNSKQELDLAKAKQKANKTYNDLIKCIEEYDK